ncbi:hypothetical protein ODH84_004816 [Vibrio alginolyticus]|nr:hypothetical protein [Vibrio alginolyticus]EJX1247190.1 hypothetical protein [Vibrio alginolyticus]
MPRAKRHNCKTSGCHNMLTGRVKYCGTCRPKKQKPASLERRFEQTKVGYDLLKDCSYQEFIQALAGIDLQALIELNDIELTKRMACGYQLKNGRIEQVRPIHVCHLAPRKWRNPRTDEVYLGAAHPCNKLLAHGSLNQSHGNRPHMIPDSEYPVHPFWVCRDKPRKVKMRDVVEAIGRDVVELFVQDKNTLVKKSGKQMANYGAVAHMLLAPSDMAGLLIDEVARVINWYDELDKNFIQMLLNELEQLEECSPTAEYISWESVKDIRSNASEAIRKEKELAASEDREPNIRSIKREAYREIDRAIEEQVELGNLRESQIQWSRVNALWEVMFLLAKDCALVSERVPFDLMRR